MNERVQNAIQALRDEADWLESLPEHKQDMIQWECSPDRTLWLSAYSQDEVWKLREAISGPGVVKEVTEDYTTWDREITDRFQLHLSLYRGNTCKPITEKVTETRPLDGTPQWNAGTQKWEVVVTRDKRIGWDCSSDDTP